MAVPCSVFAFSFGASRPPALIFSESFAQSFRQGQAPFAAWLGRVGAQLGFSCPTLGTWLKWQRSVNVLFHICPTPAAGTAAASVPRAAGLSILQRWRGDQGGKLMSQALHMVPIKHLWVRWSAPLQDGGGDHSTADWAFPHGNNPFKSLRRRLFASIKADTVKQVLQGFHFSPTGMFLASAKLLPRG